MNEYEIMLLTRTETDRLLQRIRDQQPGLVEELIPTIATVSDVQKILQNLLKEKVSIRNLEVILETLVDVGRSSKDLSYLTGAAHRPTERIEHLVRLGAYSRESVRALGRETGVTLSLWRQQACLLTALPRLASGEQVTTVALDLGYDSVAAFTTMFKRMLGAPPREYFQNTAR